MHYSDRIEGGKNMKEKFFIIYFIKIIRMEVKMDEPVILLDLILGELPNCLKIFTKIFLLLWEIRWKFSIYRL